jgi:PAS domain S-box-containing protein
MALIASDGGIAQANRSFCRMLGFTKSELQCLHLTDITHPNDVETDAEQRHRLAAADIGRYELVQRYLRKDGTAIWVRVSVGSVRRNPWEPAYSIMQIESVAPQEVSEARDTADMLTRFGDATLSAMHEIGNCLTPLMLSTEMIVEQAPGGEVRELAQQIFKAARRVAFALRRLRPIEDLQPVAYLGQNRLLDLRMVAPPSADGEGDADEAGAA